MNGQPRPRATNTRAGHERHAQARHGTVQCSMSSPMATRVGPTPSGPRNERTPKQVAEAIIALKARLGRRACRPVDTVGAVCRPVLFVIAYAREAKLRGHLPFHMQTLG